MKKHLYIIILLLAILLNGCRGAKKVVDTEVNSSMPMAQILTAHKEAIPNFKTLASRVQVVYEDGNKEQSITVSLRMEKDRIIWIKASILGITLAKAMITPDRVSYYETISNTYFDGDFTLLSDWLGTELDFDKAQSILLGQSIFRLDDNNYKVSMVQGRYKLQPKTQPFDFIHSLFLNTDNFKVLSGSLSQPSEGRLFSLRYGDYQQVQGSFYPSDIWIDATDKDEKTKISVTYKNIDVNAAVSFPFDIPEGFEQIRLSK
jgi:Domain of unknown function (DUF4292)